MPAKKKGGRGGTAEGGPNRATRARKWARSAQPGRRGHRTPRGRRHGTATPTSSTFAQSDRRSRFRIRIRPSRAERKGEGGTQGWSWSRGVLASVNPFILRQYAPYCINICIKD